MPITQPHAQPSYLPTTQPLNGPPEQPATQKAALTPEGAAPAPVTAPYRRNTALDDYARHYKPMKSANDVTAEQVQAHIKQRFGIAIDPDKAYLMTMAYEHRTDEQPYKGSIVQKISLTDAARCNIQGVELPSGMHQPKTLGYSDSTPPIEIKPESRHHEKPSADFRFPLPNTSGHTRWYQGIYQDPQPGSPNRYDASNQVPIDPESFKQMVWDNAYKKSYDNYLKDYWSPNNRAAFTTTATIAYLTAVHKQLHDQSLNENDRRIAMGVAGLPPDKAYLDITPEDLKQPYKADPNLQTKFLRFNGFESRMFYTQDLTSGRVLLYVSGLTPPAHGFDSVEAMHRWLGEQFKDPQKATVIKFQLRPEDRPNYGHWVGADARVDLIAEQLNNHASPAQQERLGYWQEGGVFDSQAFKGNPFEELQYRTEKATKSATDQQFVLNSDVTKNSVIKGLRIASYGLLFLAPLGMAIPPLGVALTIANIGIGATEVGIGIDDKLNNRPGAENRIITGVINTTKPILSEGFGQAFTPVTGPLKAFLLKP
ncbi:hypothetical protein AO268_09495 [Pseudomonas sp. ICMP 8385]|uniref:dermonecrotic toxin domain-containing protein n=1 Tax=Pseudomonas sp. ICMP 8385 TaxID=1718920 RepID=UPI000C077AAF|nr:DUF6543 domain-containing protein [Pseudomonas sp. ICMP 8385]PHN52870.1 hypothetical protein AO268_09495 [Pseudomonas sp. ICMP 8385]